MTVDPYAPPLADLELPRGTSAPALWNPDAAGAWSLVLSPIFGATLVWLNWKAIGDSRRALVAGIWLITSVVFTLLLSLTERPLFSLLFLLIWYFAAQKPQTLYVKKTWPQGYPRKKWRGPLLSAVGFLLALILLIAAIEMANG